MSSINIVIQYLKYIITIIILFPQLCISQNSNFDQLIGSWVHINEKRDVKFIDWELSIYSWEDNEILLIFRDYLELENEFSDQLLHRGKIIEYDQEKLILFKHIIKQRDKWVRIHKILSLSDSTLQLVQGRQLPEEAFNADDIDEYLRKDGKIQMPDIDTVLIEKKMYVTWEKMNSNWIDKIQEIRELTLPCSMKSFEDTSSKELIKSFGTKLVNKQDILKIIKNSSLTSKGFYNYNERMRKYIFKLKDGRMLKFALLNERIYDPYRGYYYDN